MFSGATISTSASELLGLITAATAGVVFAGHEYKKMSLKKRVNKIKAINELHTQMLTRIKVNDESESISLPVIFTIGSESDPDSIQGLHFNDAVLQDIDDSIAQNGKGELLSYDLCIQSAVSKIHRFYNFRIYERDIFHRGKPEDETSVVLCYLIEMLNTHFSSFQGCEVDIALLNALAEFINAFASLHGKNSDRLKQLTPVYNLLMRARSKLEAHAKVISLDTLVDDLIRNCKHYSFKMLKTFTKLITPADDWRFINTITVEEIMLGLIKPNTKQFRGKFTSRSFWLRDNGIMTTDCIFGQWLIRSAKDFLLAIEDDIVPGETEFVIEKEKFKNNFTEKEVKDVADKVFKHCENFLTINTSRKNKYSATDTIVPLKDGPELRQRMKIVADYANLLQIKLTTLYFAKHFQTSIRQIGLIRIRNPHQFNNVFYVFQQLKQLIKTRAAALEKTLQAVQDRHNNVEFIAAQQRLLPEMLAVLRYDGTKIASSIEKLILMHGKKLDTYDEEALIKQDQHQLYVMAQQIREKLDIPPLPQPTPVALKALPVSLPTSIITNEVKTEVEITPTPEAERELKYEEDATITEITPPSAMTPLDFYGLMQKLQAVKNTVPLDQIEKRQRYDEIYYALLSLEARELFMAAETRTEKAKQVDALGVKLCQLVLDFMDANELDQLTEADGFLKNIKDTIAAATFIKQHKPGHGFYDLLHVPTKSKTITHKIEQASEHLAHPVKTK